LSVSKIGKKIIIIHKWLGYQKKKEKKNGTLYNSYAFGSE